MDALISHLHAPGETAISWNTIQFSYISKKHNIDVHMMATGLKERCQRWVQQQLLYSEAWVVIIELSRILTNKENGGEPEPTHKRGRNLHNHWRVKKVVWILLAAADWRRDSEKVKANDITWDAAVKEMKARWPTGGTI